MNNKRLNMVVTCIYGTIQELSDANGVISDSVMADRESVGMSSLQYDSVQHVTHSLVISQTFMTS